MAKKLLIASAALVVVVGLLTASYVLYARSARRSWQLYLSDLRAAGEPVTFAEIQSRRSSTTAGSRTVADVVARVADEVKISPGPISRGVLGMPGGPDIDFFAGIPSEAIDTTRRYVVPRRPALGELATIHELQPGRFGISYDGPALDVATRFIETAPPVQGLTKLLDVDATLKLIDGETEVAASLIPMLFDVVSPLAEEPAIMAHLYRISAATSAIRILENTLRVGELRDETLEDLDGVLIDYLDSYSMKWAFAGERASFIACFDEIRSAVRVPGATPFVARYEDQRRGAEMLRCLIEAGDDSAKLLKARDRVESELLEVRETQMFTRMNLTGIPTLVTLHVCCLAEIRAARIAIAAERYHLANGELPATLDQLVPTYISELPLDPFDQSPMKRMRRDNGLVIYSVGGDAEDDGGSVVPIEGEKQPRDRGFRLLDTSRRGLVFSQTPALEGG